MNSVEEPSVYVILGAAGSGRREVLWDLIDGGLGAEARPAVMLAAAEPVAGNRRETSDGLTSGLDPGGDDRGGVARGRDAHLLRDRRAAQSGGSNGGVQGLDRAAAGGGGAGVYGDQLPARGKTPRRCALGMRRVCTFPMWPCSIAGEGVANKWLSDFRGFFSDQHVPCSLRVREGGPGGDPAPEVVEPQARRMTRCTF